MKSMFDEWISLEYLLDLVRKYDKDTNYELDMDKIREQLTGPIDRYMSDSYGIISKYNKNVTVYPKFEPRRSDHIGGVGIDVRIVKIDFSEDLDITLMHSILLDVVSMDIIINTSIYKNIDNPILRLDTESSELRFIADEWVDDPWGDFVVTAREVLKKYLSRFRTLTKHIPDNPND